VKRYIAKKMTKIVLISLIYFIPFCWSKVPNTLLSQDGFNVLEKISGSKNISKRVLNGDVISVAKVLEKSIDKKTIQILNVYGSGYHPRTCRFALRKLSLYEDYHQYVGIIKKSEYNDTTERVKFFIESSLLPFSMRMNFKLPRITKVGIYSFTFDKGFLKNLKGQIHVFEETERCLFILTAKFEGPDTGINNTILEFFSKAVVKLSLENLIRISKTY
jgi:hypothetical protein